MRPDVKNYWGHAPKKKKNALARRVLPLAAVTQFGTLLAKLKTTQLASKGPNDEGGLGGCSQEVGAEGVVMR